VKGKGSQKEKKKKRRIGRRKGGEERKWRLNRVLGMYLLKYFYSLALP